MWKKVGAALGSAVMIGATLAGAALATGTQDLGDYSDLMVSDAGVVSGMVVVGANAATADVVSAINMGAFIGQNVLKAGSGEGGVTLTPISTDVSGVKRHVGLDKIASHAFEFGGSTATTDTVASTGFASGDGIVDYLYSYKDKGPIYVNGSDVNWYEKVDITLANIKALRDTKDTNDGDKYDEVFLEVQGNAITYQLYLITSMAGSDLKGKKIWFMGKEYTVISAAVQDKVKLGASDAEVVLSTADPSVTIGGIDTTLGGIYAAGTGNAYTAKITVTNGGQTETKYVLATETETIAGIEVYVKNAVVTTTGTNEGEAQMVIGAGILKLEDGGYLKLGDGTETTWQVTHGTATSGSGTHFQSISVKDTEPHTTVSSTNTVLYPGDSLMSPNNLFGLTYNGLSDKYGAEPSFVDVDITPTTRDLDKDGTAQAVIRVRTPGGDFLSYKDNGNTSMITSELWVNTTEVLGAGVDNRWYYKDPSASTLTYEKVCGMNTSLTATEAPYVKLTTSNTVLLYYNNSSQGICAQAGCMAGNLTLTEPELQNEASGIANRYNITIEYNGTAASSVGQFESLDTDGTDRNYYVYYNATADGDNFIAREGTTTPTTRDYYTRWGTYVDSVGQTLVSLRMPQEQLFGEYIVGTQDELEGASISAEAGETVAILGGQVKVAGSVGGVTKATLPSSIAKLDTDVTAADKTGYNLVLVGGPAVNTLVNGLQTEGKLTKTIGAAGSTADIAAAGAGVIELVADAFATGKYAIVVAGSDRTGTSKAAAVLAQFDSNSAMLDGKTVYEV
jgi:hypothetical protein